MPNLSPLSRVQTALQSLRGKAGGPQASVAQAARRQQHPVVRLRLHPLGRDRPRLRLDVDLVLRPPRASPLRLAVSTMYSNASFVPIHALDAATVAIAPATSACSSALWCRFALPSPFGSASSTAAPAGSPLRGRACRGTCGRRPDPWRWTMGAPLLDVFLGHRPFVSVSNSLSPRHRSAAVRHGPLWPHDIAAENGRDRRSLSIGQSGNGSASNR